MCKEEDLHKIEWDESVLASWPVFFPLPEYECRCCHGLYSSLTTAMIHLNEEPRSQFMRKLKMEEEMPELAEE